MAAAMPRTPRTPKAKALKPRRLGPGSVIGIAAPSGPFVPQAFERGLEVLRTMEFRVRMPDGLFASRGYLAGTDAHRAAVFESVFCDPGIDAVMAARGGYGCLRILPLLDFARLAAHPKALIGFSDVTALLTAMGSRCGLATFHGPMVTTLAGASERTLRGLREAVASDRVPDIEEVDVCQTPFYEMMQQKAATKIQKVVQMIEISEMTGDTASILKSGAGSPMLMLHRLLVGTDGRPLAYTRLMGDGKKYKLQTEMIQFA